ncbi:MAG: ABC transporter substrate-binding protein [Chloroflexota bacterium]
MFGRHMGGKAAGVAASFVLMLGACTGGGTDASDGAGSGDADLPLVRMQGLPADPAAIPMLVMQEQGIDVAHGFRAEFIEVDPDAAANTLLIGESDVAMEQDAVTMTLAQQQGQAGVVFYPVLNTMMGVVVADDSEYQEPADLVGQRVGHFGVDSGTTSIICLMLAELHDVDCFNDFDLREAGPAALPELLASGEVEAIFDYEPLALRAVIETPGRYLFEPAKAWADRSDGWSPPLTNLAARVDWLEENPDLAIAVRDAWAEATQVVSDSNYEILNDEPYKTFMAMGSEEELAAFIEYCADLPCLLNSWTEEDVQHTNDWLTLMADRDVLIEETAADPVAVVLEDFLGR